MPKWLDEKSGPHPDCEHVPSTLEDLLAVLHFVFSSGISVRCSCRNFGTSIITLVLPPVLVLRDGSFRDFVSLYQGQVPQVAMGRSQYCASSGWSSFIRLCGVLNTSCCGSECKAKFWFSLVMPNVSFLRPAGVRVVPTETFMSAFSLVVSSTGNFYFSIFGLHEVVEVQCVRWSNSQFQRHDIRECTKPRSCKTSTFTRSWTCQCFTTARA